MPQANIIAANGGLGRRRRFGFLSAENQKRKPRGLPHAVSDGAFAAALWAGVHHIEGSAFTEPTLPWSA